MHIEPGLVDGARMALSWGTAAAAAGWSVRLIAQDLRLHDPVSFALRAVLATAATLVCYEVLPHFSAGVSEVHLIFGTMILLLLGAGPAAVGLAGGLAVQGLLFAPYDLPMYTVNVTTLLFPLFAIHHLAGRIVPARKPYVDLSYAEVLKLSAVYQGGIIAWVAFWVFYGQGLAIWPEVAAFATAYLLVIVLEPVVDLGALALAKALRRHKDSGLFVSRLHHPAP